MASDGYPFLGYAEGLRSPVWELTREVAALRTELDALRGEVTALRAERS